MAHNTLTHAACACARLKPEPRPIPSGHIPGSCNLFFQQCLQDGSLKSSEEIQQLAAERGLDLTGSKPIVTSCGSGVSAAVVYLSFVASGMVNRTRVFVGCCNLVYVWPQPVFTLEARHRRHVSDGIVRRLVERVCDSRRVAARTSNQREFERFFDQVEARLRGCRSIDEGCSRTRRRRSPSA